MATKIVRKIAKIFGSTAGATDIGEFGSLAAGTPVYSTDPTVIQSLSNWLQGWLGAVIGGNSPAIEDMNAFCYVMAYQVAYLMQTGIAEWDATTNYFVGSMVNNGSGIIYVSITNSNLNNALTDGTNWRVQGGASPTNVSTTYTALISDEIIRGDTTSAGFTITLPTIATSKGKKFIIKNVGTHTLTIKGNGAELIDGANTNADMEAFGNSTTVFNNGTTWDIL